jgi:hypothetical protein
MKIINRFNMLSDAIQDHHRTWGSVFLVDKDIAPLQVPAQPRTPNPTKGALLNRGKPISPSMSESLSFIRHLQTINNPLAFFSPSGCFSIRRLPIHNQTLPVENKIK